MKRKLNVRKTYFGNYKLYPHEVVNIYYLVNTADLPQGDIAEHYEISKSHVCNIGKARFWQHLLPVRR